MSISNKASDELAADNFFEDQYRLSSNSLQAEEEVANQLKNEMMKVDKRFCELVLENIYLNCIRVSLFIIQ